MRISDWSSDVCSSDLIAATGRNGSMTTFRDNLLAGKAAFVAGGTSGINLGIAKRFAELGAKVAVAGRDPDKAQRAAAEIGRDAIGLSGDVRDYVVIRGVMGEGADRLGPMDIVISEIGGASSRDRVCQYVSISVVAVSLKKKTARDTRSKT